MLLLDTSEKIFVDALLKDIKIPEATLPSKAIAYCNKIFEIEKELSLFEPDARKI